MQALAAALSCGAEVLRASEMACEGSWMKNALGINRHKDTHCGSRCLSYTNPWKPGTKSCRTSELSMLFHSSLVSIASHCQAQDIVLHAIFDPLWLFSCS